ncbi:MAG: type II CRISPR RNA-guided endonuclease Cas9 [Tannerellaceae bacterium]|jgi:CRISPR-associated endonuclease Csn1|nr:type II CRISPR RNA-guided endonuclease Cas9 [Tannerellaceae bacterium]
MKTILGLDLGTSSIGWALVHEAEHEEESSTIQKLGVRIITYDNFCNKKNGTESKDPEKDYLMGKGITPNAKRTQKRSARRNLQRYKLRRENLIEILKQQGFITDTTILSERGNATTFETYRLRATAAKEKVSLEEFSRILLMINKKRGYKSNRKIKSKDEGESIDGMELAEQLYENDITPGQLVYQFLKEKKENIPDFYRSDLQAEFDKIWCFQKHFYPDILTDEFKIQLSAKGKQDTTKIFQKAYEIFTADNKAKNRKLQTYQWRTEALTKQLSKEELAFVFSDLNGCIKNSSGYLGSISDRKKELFFRKQTIGEYLMEQLSQNPHTSLRNQTFYRQDYLDEFDKIWETQAQYYKELTPELKHEIRDIVIFYQRRLKSQKGLVGFCKLESKRVKMDIDGKSKIKTIGLKVIPHSSLLFQEFRIWQTLDKVRVKGKSSLEEGLSQEQKEILFQELSIKEQLSENEILDLLLPKNHKGLSLNFENIDGNKTLYSLYQKYQTIIEKSTSRKLFDLKKTPAKEITKIIAEEFNVLGYSTDILYFDSEKVLDKQPIYRLWHLLYSFEEDNSPSGNDKLINKIRELFGFNKEHATIISKITFPNRYGNLSAKAIRKILPFLKKGEDYDSACKKAGYQHSKFLKDKLDLLPKNSLQNPIVEKILNQMVNVVNTIVEVYGKPDEIRIELARELKQNAKERKRRTEAINKASKENEGITQEIKKEFGLPSVSFNDITRYKLYKELEGNGFRTLYSNTYIRKDELYEYGRSQEELYKAKKFDIEHIIPKSLLLNDSFPNKTLELREVNVEKGNNTAYDYVKKTYGESGLQEYLARINKLFQSDPSKKSKLKNLKTERVNIPNDFIERDIRETQYITRQAKTLLEELVPRVVCTTGSITDRLRKDWQLIHTLRELNFTKYEELGLTEVVERENGKRQYLIKNWTKRNDHRHHAMDALIVAFTKEVYIQYLNTLNAQDDKSPNTYAIKTKYLKDGSFLTPFQDFRIEARKHLKNTLISIKSKNKVTTTHINITKKKDGFNKQEVLTPRGPLHNDTIYGSIQRIETEIKKVDSSFTEEQILKVRKKIYREALLNRLHEFENDPQKAFTGKNSLTKNPISVGADMEKVPEKIEIKKVSTSLTTRRPISHEIKIDKILDPKIREILDARLKEFNNDPKKAFSNIDNNPIWLNKQSNISIKRVTTIENIHNGTSLHNKEGKIGTSQSVDFVDPDNNHHAALYRDRDGKVHDTVITFWKVTTRKIKGEPIIDEGYKKAEGWKFLFSVKKNEFFVFPDKKTGFDPKSIDLMDSANYKKISPNLFRVQAISKRDYLFRHHLETRTGNESALKDLTYKRVTSLSTFETVVKVRIDHIGRIVSIGEY